MASKNKKVPKPAALSAVLTCSLIAENATRDGNTIIGYARNENVGRLSVDRPIIPYTENAVDRSDNKPQLDALCSYNGQVFLGVSLSGFESVNRTIDLKVGGITCTGDIRASGAGLPPPKLPNGYLIFVPDQDKSTAIAELLANNVGGSVEIEVSISGTTSALRDWQYWWMVDPDTGATSGDYQDAGIERIEVVPNDECRFFLDQTNYATEVGDEVNLEMKFFGANHRDADYTANASYQGDNVALVTSINELLVPCSKNDSVKIIESTFTAQDLTAADHDTFRTWQSGNDVSLIPLKDTFIRGATTVFGTEPKIKVLELRGTSKDDIHLYLDATGYDIIGRTARISLPIPIPGDGIRVIQSVTCSIVEHRGLPAVNLDDCLPNGLAYNLYDWIKRSHERQCTVYLKVALDEGSPVVQYIGDWLVKLENRGGAWVANDTYGTMLANRTTSPAHGLGGDGLEKESYGYTVRLSGDYPADSEVTFTYKGGASTFSVMVDPNGSYVRWYDSPINALLDATMQGAGMSLSVSVAVKLTPFTLVPVVYEDGEGTYWVEASDGGQGSISPASVTHPVHGPFEVDSFKQLNNNPDKLTVTLSNEMVSLTSDDTLLVYDYKLGVNSGARLDEGDGYSTSGDITSSSMMTYFANGVGNQLDYDLVLDALPHQMTLVDEGSILVSWQPSEGERISLGVDRYAPLVDGKPPEYEIIKMFSNGADDVRILMFTLSENSTALVGENLEFTYYLPSKDKSHLIRKSLSIPIEQSGDKVKAVYTYREDDADAAYSLGLYMSMAKDLGIPFFAKCGRSSEEDSGWGNLLVEVRGMSSHYIADSMVGTLKNATYPEPQFDATVRAVVTPNTGGAHREVTFGLNDVPSDLNAFIIKGLDSYGDERAWRGIIVDQNAGDEGQPVDNVCLIGNPYLVHDIVATEGNLTEFKVSYANGNFLTHTVFGGDSNFEPLPGFKQGESGHLHNRTFGKFGAKIWAVTLTENPDTGYWDVVMFQIKSSADKATIEKATVVMRLIDGTELNATIKHSHLDYYNLVFDDPSQLVRPIQRSSRMPLTFDLTISSDEPEDPIVDKAKTLLEQYIQYVKDGKAETLDGWIYGQENLLYRYHELVLSAAGSAFFVLMEYTVTRFTEEAKVLTVEQVTRANGELPISPRYMVQFNTFLTLAALPVAKPARRQAMSGINKEAIIQVFVDNYDQHQIMAWLNY